MKYQYKHTGGVKYQHKHTGGVKYRAFHTAGGVKSLVFHTARAVSNSFTLFIYLINYLIPAHGFKSSPIVKVYTTFPLSLSVVD